MNHKIIKIIVLTVILISMFQIFCFADLILEPHFDPETPSNTYVEDVPNTEIVSNPSNTSVKNVSNIEKSNTLYFAFFAILAGVVFIIVIATIIYAIRNRNSSKKAKISDEKLEKNTKE